MTVVFCNITSTARAFSEALGEVATESLIFPNLQFLDRTKSACHVLELNVFNVIIIPGAAGAFACSSLQEQ